MAFTSILRKSGSSLAPLATRLVRGQRNYHRALFTAKTQSNLSHSHRLSFLSPLLEIQCLQEIDDHDRDLTMSSSFFFCPSDFPFKIVDNPGLQTLTLKRTYQGEEIEVEVHMPDLKNRRSLEFSCISYPDEIEIDYLAVKCTGFSEDEITYKGPSLNDLPHLQKPFERYLKLRGIKPSTIKFLHEYMINKNSKEELIWMKELKKFIEA
ncbi:hypothetical protein ACB092_06G198600 [Castanea dentata]